MKRKTNRRAAITGLLAISIILIILFTLFNVLVGQARPILEEETMARANQLYSKGHYQEAASTYQQLVDQGYSGSSLYYNLGNAHYRLGNLGYAIYNYEQALRIAPRDGDIRANLLFVRSQTLDQYEQESTHNISPWFQGTENWLTMDETALLALGLFWLLALLLVGFRHTAHARIHRGLGYSLILVGMIFILAVLAFGGRVYARSYSPQAIVIVDSVDVLDSPGGEGSNFTLHSGSKITLTSQVGQWAEVRLPGDQFHGWVLIDDIAVLK